MEITENDITTNLPYNSKAHLVFDHHLSETLRLGGARPENYVIDPEAPSAARVVYEYFGGRERFVGIPQEMMRAVDQADSARYSREDILAPEAGPCSTISWTRARAWGASANSGSATTS